MKKLVYLLFILAILASSPAYSQHAGAKEAIAARIILPNYRFPITDKLKLDDFSAKGLEVEYARHLNSFLNVSFPFKIYHYKVPTGGSSVEERGLGFISLDALLQVKFANKTSVVYPYLFGGGGLTLESLDKLMFEVPVGIGLNFKIFRQGYFSTKLENRFNSTDFRENIQAGLGLLFFLGEEEPDILPAKKDSDGDGITDDQDLCPTAAGIAALNGCPDRDGDGIADASDQCPDQAGIPAFQGCPDTDGDKIADKDDKCPNEAGPSENGGCPIKDADGDGVADAEDECPTVKGPLSLKGCPDSDGDSIADKNDDCPGERGLPTLKGCPDSDGDGIANNKDKCPNSAGPASNNGCPEIKAEDKEVLTFAMKAVQFETARDNLKQESFAVLDQIVEILRKYPDYKLRINGHTDSIGEAQPNQVLSEKRAKACYNYLATRGIDSGKMSYFGFGESKPIADNRYKDGREKNRRVEFDLYLDN